MKPSTIRFGIHPSTASVGPARDHLRQSLQGRTIPTELVGDAELVLTELVTNAIQHAAPPIEVELRMEDHCLTVEVSDHSPAIPPSLQETDVGRIGGWGLAILAAVSEAWGFTSHQDYKVVWARLVPRPA